MRISDGGLRGESRSTDHEARTTQMLNGQTNPPKSRMQTGRTKPFCSQREGREADGVDLMMGSLCVYSQVGGRDGGWL